MSANPFDQACRYLAKLDPALFLAWLLPLSAARFRGWLDTRTLPFPGEPERTCDTVAALVNESEPEVFWAMPIEFQTRPGTIYSAACSNTSPGSGASCARRMCRTLAIRSLPPSSI